MWLTEDEIIAQPSKAPFVMFGPNIGTTNFPIFVHTALLTTPQWQQKMVENGLVADDALAKRARFAWDDFQDPLVRSAVLKDIKAYTEANGLLSKDDLDLFCGAVERAATPIIPRYNPYKHHFDICKIVYCLILFIVPPTKLKVLLKLPCLLWLSVLCLTNFCFVCT